MADKNLFDDVLGEVQSGQFDPSSTKPARPSIFNETLGEVAGAVDRRRNLAVLAGTQAKPDEYATHKSIAEAFGVSTEFAARNKAELEPKLAQRDLGELLSANPPLADWYSQGDNPASIKVDELRQLDGLSWLWQSAVEATQAGQQTSELARLRQLQMNGDATPEQIEQANQISIGREPRSFGADNWLQKGWVGAFQQAPLLAGSVVQGVRRGLEFGTAAAGVAAIAGQAGPQIAAPEELATVPGAYAGGFLVGTTFGAWEASFATEAPLAFDEFLMMRDENGQPLDEDVARSAALIAGLGSSVLETFADVTLAKLIPGVDRLFGGTSRDAVKAALLQPTIRTALKDFATNTLKAGATEITTEVAQEATQIFVGEIVKQYANTTGAEFAAMEPDDIAARLGDAAVQTAQAMTIMGPVLAGTRLGVDLRRAREATRSIQIMEGLTAHAQGNQEALKRIPDKVRDAVATLTKDGPVQNVYVSPEAFSTYFQTTEELSTFMEEVGLTAEYGEASRLGRDIQIPVDLYYTKIAGSEIGEAVKKFARISQDVMTSVEADEFNEAWGEAKEALFAEYDATQQSERAALEGEERVFEDVKNKAMEAGITPDQAQQYAKLYSTFFRVMGERASIDPAELFNRYGFDIKRALPEETQYRPVNQTALDLAVIRSGKVEGMRKNVAKAGGPSLLAAIKDIGGIEDVGGDLAAMDFPKRLIKTRDGTGDMLGGATENLAHPDAVAQRLWERGYFAGRQDQPGGKDLLDAIQAELAGEPMYSFEHDRRGDAEIQAQAGLVAFADALDQYGIDVTSMTDEEVQAELDKITNADPNAGALFQAAYHGTPHKFEDGFSTERIGTGEGNQAFGWGLYFAGKKEVAEFYRDSLSAKWRSGEDINWNGKNVTEHYEAADKKNQYGRLMVLEGIMLHQPKSEIITRMNDAIADGDTQAVDGLAYLKTLPKEAFAETDGRLFSVEIPEDSDLLDFDKPLAKQSANVKAILKGTGLLKEFKENLSDFASPQNSRGQSKGTNLYSYLSWKLGGDKAASLKLAELGIPGHRYPAGTIANVSGKGHNYVIYDDTKVKVLEFYQEAEVAPVAGRKSVKRGSIQFGEGVTIINMFDQADLSTFLHESGHFFLQVFADIANSDQADMSVANDWAALVDYLGVDEDGKIGVEAHEKFARSFEAYLFEGKTPSAELTDIMTRFRSWLVFVYKQVQALRAPIDDNIRGVMSRMLATDAEIKSMQSAPEFRPAFKSATDAGMTPEQWERYNVSAAKAVDRAKRELDVKMMSEVQRETSAEYRAAKTAIRKAVKAEYEAIPAYRVLAYLRTGKLEGLPEGTPTYKLDRASIVKMMGEGALIRMPKGVPPLYRAEGGVHPDAIAELFGFKSGHDMLTAIMSAPNLGRAITEEVSIRMRAKFGDLLGDANARVREAEAAIANDDTGELLQAELEVLVRKGLVNTKLNKEAASRAAKRAIRAKPIREAIRLKLYMNANAKAAAEAEKAILKGDWKAAIAAKQRQLLNHYMAIEAREAQRVSDSAVAYLSKFTGKKRPKGLAVDYLEQIDGLLERFDLRKSVGPAAAQRRIALSEWIAAQEAQGLLVSIPDALRNDAMRKPYREMTVDDLLALTDTVKSIEHLGRLKDKLLANKAAREFDAVRNEVLASIMVNQELGRVSPNQNPTTGEKLLSTVKSVDAGLLKIEQVLSWLDGGDINGALRRHVWQPIADAEARENDMRVTYTGKIFDILGGLDKQRLAERITVGSVDTTFARSEIMAVALNLGNLGNREKMMKAGNGKGPWSDADVSAIVQHLNKEEWDAVQNIWDTINELWPEIAALQKRLSGVAPPKVEAATVETPYGTLKGGYYPIIYDPTRSPDVEDRNAAAADKLFENTYLKPETLHGFTKERSRSYYRPMLLDLDRAGSHIVAVIHDLTHREAIMDAHKIMTDRTVRSEIEARYGREIYQQFVPWLQSIAHDNVKNDGLAGVEAVMRGVRSRATMVGMGFRVTTILTQVAGFSSVMEMVSPRYLATGLGQFIKSPRALNAQINSMSSEMRHRGKSLDRDVRDELRRLAGKHSLADDAKRFAFHGIAFMDRVVTVPAWLGAYSQHLASYPGDVAGATAFADQVVRLTSGAGGAKDLAAIQRQNEGTKLITMFYSYFSAYYNRQRTWGRAAKKAIQNGTFSDVPSLLAQQVFMTIGPAVLADLIVGQGPGEDEDYASWVAKKVALYPFMALPLVRDAISALDSGFGYTFTPAGRTVQESILDPIKLIAKIAEGEATARETVVQAITTTGYVFNLPLGQLATTTNNVWKAIEEDDLQLRDFVVSR